MDFFCGLQQSFCDLLSSKSQFHLIHKTTNETNCFRDIERSWSDQDEKRTETENFPLRSLEVFIGRTRLQLLFHGLLLLLMGAGDNI